MTPRWRRGVWAGAATMAAAALAFAAVCWSRAELKPVPASFMLLDRHGAFLAQIGGDNAAGYGYWPAPPASDRIVVALLALEDRRFWQHPGVDPLAVARAAWQNLTTGHRVSGASSIAMQVARLQQPSPRTFGNKLLEAGTAFCLIVRHGREAVLRQYLRLVPFGNRSHGVAHAARFYFDKPAADLSWAEIALLAALPQAPTRMNPYSPEGRRQAIERGQRVLTHLHAAGVIAPRDFALAERQLADLRPAPRPQRPPEALHAALRLEAMLGGADTWLGQHQEARIQSTIDLGLQREVERVARRQLDSLRAAGAEQVAVMVVERRSLEVLAALGSADYFGAEAGAIDFAATSRSPGSTLKPFLYGLAFDRGAIRADVALEDEPEVAPGIENADRRFLGRLLPRQALATSRNTPAAALVRHLGLEEVYGFLRRLDLHDGLRPARHYGLGLSVGALPTSLARLVQAYGALANDGLLGELVWYRGQDVPRPSRVLSAAAARQVSLFLSDPMARLPSFSRRGPAEFAFPVALKTGTSQDYRDAWTVAYSPHFIVGVWIGRPQADGMHGVTGMSSAARLVRSLMLALHAQPGRTLEDLSFPAPEGYRAVDVCGGTGRNDCSARFREWVPDRDPEDEAHTVLVDRRTGGLADQSTPAEEAIEAPLPAQRPIRTVSPPPGPSRPRILSPLSGIRLIRDPDLPPEAQAIALRAAGDGALTWYVDDKPYAAGAASSWPLQPGVHRLQVRRTDGAASAVTVIEVE